MIRIVKLFFTGLCLCFLFSGCEKEYSLETGGLGGTTTVGGTSSGTATFSLTGAPGACSTPVISGNYIAGTALTAANTVIVTVNVDTIGTYAITTATINGISFTGSGTFTMTGSQIVVLTGTGTPIAAGTNTFIPGSNGCTFTLVTQAVGSGPVAVYTLAGAPNACTAPVISGLYTVGTALGAANTVQLTVNVTTAGNYTITTPTVDGFHFAGTGTLAAGNQTITLTGSGTPTGESAAVFTPVTGGCSFTINVIPLGGTATYTLNGSPNACTTPSIAGTYETGLALSAGNTITISANVTAAGTYIVSTNTANGITFSGTGNLTVGTNQPIVLIGTGTPTAATTSSFTATNGGCSFPVTVVAPPPAVYTLAGAPGACAPITVGGQYSTGNALDPANNIAEIQVNVTTAGAYTITSTTVNGMTFSATGLFTATGMQTVDLTGSGTPVAAGTNTFTAGTNGCTFVVTVTAPLSPCTGLVDNQFSLAGHFTVTGAPFGLSNGLGQYQVSIQENFISMQMLFPGDNPPAPGTYSIGTVTITCPDANFISNALTWTATSGSVYVGLNQNGANTYEFCNVNFASSGPLGGGSSAIGQARAIL